jgi:hypothetical protein
VTGRTVVLDWRPLRRSSLRSFCRIRFPSGIEIADIGVHQAESKIWASPPGKPMIDRDGAALRDEDGKVRYSAIVSFMTHGVRSRWSHAVIAALRDVHPEAFDAPETAE